MTCNECSHLRRCQGGISLGGVVDGKIVPACPCKSFPKLIDTDVQQITFNVPIDFQPNFAVGYFQYRYCATREGLMCPRILSVEFLNYDMNDFFWQFFIEGYKKRFDGCEIDTGVALEFLAYRSSLGDDYHQCFEADTTPGYALLPRWYLYMYAEYNLPYEPVVKLNYRFDS